MDGCSSKRAVNGLVISRKGSGVVLRDSVNNREPNAQYCNRHGCKGRLNSAKGPQVGCPEKAKYERRSSSSNNPNKSSRTCSTLSVPNKSFSESLTKLPYDLGSSSSGASNDQDEHDVLEPVPPSGKLHKGLTVNSGNSKSGVASSRRFQRNFNKTSAVRKQDTSVGSSVSLENNIPGQVLGVGSSKYGLRKLRCKSVSNNIPSGLDSNHSKRKNLAGTTNSEGESSSTARGNKMSGSSLGRISNSGYSISISDSGQARYVTPKRENSVAPVRTRRSTNGCSAGELSTRENGNISTSGRSQMSLSLHDSPVIVSQMPQPDISINAYASSSSFEFPLESTSSSPISYSQPRNVRETVLGVRQFSPAEIGTARSLMNSDSFRSYNVGSFAEVLSTLQRLEADEELIYEQLTILETNLFLSGLSFYDQHRDMRLDIDNMSYEELLALEERMGTVSTALTEEALTKCLKRNLYQSTPSQDSIVSCSDAQDDCKCCICQEEYVSGDEVGRLQCEHRYHVSCIQQWLRLKSWCPICKVSAASLAESSPS